MKKQTEIYTHQCKNGTKAKITFNRPTNEEILESAFGLTNDVKEPDDWYFESCTYTVGSKSCNAYTIQDWEDLRELSEEILKLNKEMTKSNGIAPVAFAEQLKNYCSGVVQLVGHKILALVTLVRIQFPEPFNFEVVS